MGELVKSQAWLGRGEKGAECCNEAGCQKKCVKLCAPLNTQVMYTR